MRTLWSQVSRPNLAGSFTSVRSAKQSEATTASVVRVLARRTTTAPVKRRLTFNDAFTLLLTPVFGTAFIIDTSWKEKQRKDWEKKLAAVNGEIEELHARAQHYSSSLADAVLYNGRRQQFREYTTSSRPQYQSEPSQSEVAGGAQLEEFELLEWEYRPSPANHDASHHNADPSSRYSPEELADAFQFQRLVATLLALRMLTHFHLSITPRFVSHDDEAMIRGDSNPDVDQLSSQMTINQLTTLTKRTRSQINSILAKKLDLRGMASVIEHEVGPDIFQKRMRQSFVDMLARNRSVYSIVREFAELLAGSPNSVPSSVTYSHFLHVLCKSQNAQSLAYYVSSALKSSELPLDDRTLYTMITHFGKTRDLIQFDSFLHSVLRRPPAHYLNVENPWILVRFKGISVPLPGNLNPQILQSLVRTAVKCGQLDKADAWFSSLQDGGCGPEVKAHLLHTFLQHYSIAMNWEHGRLWIATCLEHVVSFLSAVTSNVISVFIFRMLDLCVACGRVSEYTVILQAAVDAGLPPPETKLDFPVRYTHRAQRILEEWRALSIPTASETATDEVKVRRFATLCAPIIESISTPGSANMREFEKPELTRSVQDSQTGVAMAGHGQTMGQHGEGRSELQDATEGLQTSMPVQKGNDIDMQTQAKIAATQGLLELSQQRQQEQNDLINELRQHLAAKEREHKDVITGLRERIHDSEVVIGRQAETIRKQVEKQVEKQEVPRRLPGTFRDFGIGSTATYSTSAFSGDKRSGQHQHSDHASGERRTTNRPNDSAAAVSLKSQNSNVDSDVPLSEKDTNPRSGVESKTVTVGHSHSRPSVSELLFGEQSHPSETSIPVSMSSSHSTDEVHRHARKEASTRHKMPTTIPHGKFDFQGPIYLGKSSDLTADHRFDLSHVGKALPEVEQQHAQDDVVPITRHFVSKEPNNPRYRTSSSNRNVPLHHECYATNRTSAQAKEQAYSSTFSARHVSLDPEE